jgi:hypothetical protein
MACPSGGPVEATVCPLTPHIEPTIRPVAARIEATIHAVAVPIEPPIDTIAFAIETTRQLVVACGLCMARTPVEPPIDTISRCITPCLVAVAAIVETLVDTVTAPIEALLDAIAARVEPLGCCRQLVGQRGRRRERQEQQYHPCVFLHVSISLVTVALRCLNVSDSNRLTRPQPPARRATLACRAASRRERTLPSDLKPREKSRGHRGLQARARAIGEISGLGLRFESASEVLDIDKRIVILGGGTAGWITANALIHRWGDKGATVTLVESPDIGTVGVGEGSTPRLKHFFDAIGIAEKDWMPRCNATYKNGITFANWSTRPGYEHYFHPFPSVIDQHTTTAFYLGTFARRQGADVHAHPDRFFLSARLASDGLGPIPNENFPFVVEYGYHFDAHLLGEYLKEVATARGVRHVAARVGKINQSADAHITSLDTDTGDCIEGDFFVDCSGFRGVLVQETLGVPFRSFRENLFNDAAVVLPTEQGERIGTQTVSTALKFGWAWEIPLTHRIGNGYVYSSDFCSADAAEAELRALLGVTDTAVKARHLRMKVGRVEDHWYKNCLAVGLSQGFIEPLEATALNLVCNTIDDFMDSWEADHFTDQGREAFNTRAGQRFEAIRDYIVAHYIMNTRDDTEYWSANRANTHLSDTLKAIIDLWKGGKILSQELEAQKIESSYTASSWNCLFAGYGFYPPLRETPLTEQARQQLDCAAVDEFIRRSALNFRTQRELLTFDGSA